MMCTDEKAVMMKAAAQLNVFLTQSTKSSIPSTAAITNICRGLAFDIELDILIIPVCQGVRRFERGESLTPL
jgi:hypothetical protein